MKKYENVKYFQTFNHLKINKIIGVRNRFLFSLKHMNMRTLRNEIYSLI